MFFCKYAQETECELGPVSGVIKLPMPRHIAFHSEDSLMCVDTCAIDAAHNQFIV